MARFLKGILGGFEGLVGTVVGSTWRTIDVMKSRSKKSKKAPVQEQIDQRFIFGMVIKFLTFMKDVIDLGYQSNTSGMTPMNAALSYNVQNAVTGISPVFELNYPEVVLSVGSLHRAKSVTAIPEPANQIKIDWLSDNVKQLSSTYEPEKDDAMVIIFNTKDEMYSFETVKRSVGTLTMTLPRSWQGDPLHGWLFFTSPDHKKVSKSQYIGAMVTIA